MASRVGLVALAFLLAVAVPGLAVNFDVGGSDGWTNGGSYDTWVAGKTFAAGDTLTFTYDTSTHTVVQVASKSEYDSCNGANPLTSSSSSPTKITLDKAGTTYYFVCGTVSHCLSGMKLAVTTAAAGGGSPTPATPTAPATPSSPSTPTATPATPATPSAPTPKSSAAAAVTTRTAAAVAGVIGAGLAAALLA